MISESNQVLEFLQEKGDTFVKLSTVERKRLADLENAILHIHNETKKYRTMAKEAAVDVMNLHVQTPHPAYQRADGNDVSKQALQITKKVLNGLEAKLNKLLQRKSEIMNCNKQKKSEINHQRRMRIQTEIAQAKVEATLLEIKERIEALGIESAEIVAERERIVKEKDHLERVNEEEQKNFTEQHEAMSIFIKQQNMALEDALMKERKFDKNPTNDTILNDIAPKAISDNQAASNAMVTTLTLEEEIDMAKQVGRLANFVNSEQNSLSTIVERINNYELMFEQLKRMTSSSNLEDVIASYLSHEEEMFSLYHFIQETNSEIERIGDLIESYKADMRNFEKEQVESDDSKKVVIDELHRIYDESVAMNNTISKQNKHNHDSLVQASQKINNIFYALNCGSRVDPNISQKKSPPTTMDNRMSILLSQEVGENTVLEYMGVIEKRAVDIIAAYTKATQVIESRNNNNLPSSPSMRFTSPGGLTTSANWNSNYPSVNIDEINEIESGLETTKEHDNNQGDFIKPIDLTLYKDKLMRKQSNSNQLALVKKK